MLDIITTSVSTDLAEIFAWGSFHSTIQSAISSGTPISSILRKSSSAAEKVMKVAIEDFKGLKG
jgi:predicted proteasome-type protease